MSHFLRIGSNIIDMIFYYTFFPTLYVVFLDQTLAWN